VTTILLARHGETDWNRDGRFQGHADPALNDLGRRQAHELGLRMRGERLDAIWSSDLRRAAETAQHVAGRLGLKVLNTRGLREMDVGSWSGLTRDEIAERWPTEYERWREGGHGWDDGERFEAMQRRVVEAVLAIASTNPGQRVLVVTHGGPIRALHAFAEGITLAEHRRRRGPASNCEVVPITVRDGVIAPLHSLSVEPQSHDSAAK
jgi:probable phosphoglycerate mutase